MHLRLLIDSLVLGQTLARKIAFAGGKASLHAYSVSSSGVPRARQRMGYSARNLPDLLRPLQCSTALREKRPRRSACAQSDHTALPCRRFTSRYATDALAYNTGRATCYISCAVACQGTNTVCLRPVL